MNRKDRIQYLENSRRRAEAEHLRKIGRVDWSDYTSATTLREAFKKCGLHLLRAGPKTRGTFHVSPGGWGTPSIFTGDPKALYAWLHKTHGCPCDPYWLT